MGYNLRNRSFLKEIDFSQGEFNFLLRLSSALKVAKYAGTEVKRLEGKEIALIFEKTMIPVDPGFVSLDVRRAGDGVELRWTDSTTRADTFYRVFRGSDAAGFRDTVCERRGAEQCELRSETLVTTRERRFVDPNPPPDAVYRVGVAANWLDETDRGDVFVLSRPVAPPG